MNPLFGDMLIIRREDGSLPPGKLLAAFTVLASTMHQEFAKPIYSLAHPDKSKESCILASLTTRDFLWSVGFRRASVLPVVTAIEARQDKAVLHSVGIGARGAVGPGWTGHLVVSCAGWLIDTTLYQAVRPAWPALPGMLVAPLGTRALRSKTLFDLHPLAAVLFAGRPGYELNVLWLDNPKNTGWSKAPDAQRERRKPIVQAMTAQIEEARARRLKETFACNLS